MVSPDTTFNSIIELCLDHPSITVSDLHGKLSSRQSMSLAQLYKIVADLIDKQILTKSHKKLSIHPLWITSIWVLYDRAQHLLWAWSTSIQLELGQNHIRYADTLKSLDNMRNIATHYAMNHTTQDQSWYFYNSHTYHVLWMRDIELWGLQGMSSHGRYPICFIAGSDTVLDHHGCQLLTDSAYAIAQVAHTSFPAQWYFLNVYGDYYIEVVLPIALSSYFQVYFDTVTSLSDFPHALFEQLFEFKTQLRVKLTHDPVQAQQYRSQLQSYFW